MKKRFDGIIEVLRFIDFRILKLKSKVLGRFVFSEKLFIYFLLLVVIGFLLLFIMLKNIIALGIKLVRKVFFRNERVESLKKVFDVEFDVFSDFFIGVVVESEEFVFLLEFFFLEKIYGGYFKSVKEGSNSFYFGEI